MWHNQGLRLRIGLALIIGFAALSTARTLQQAAMPVLSGAPDEISAYGRKIAKASALLPPEGQVGYVSDDEGSAFFKNYYLTQYFLAPLLVRNIDDKLSDAKYSSPLISRTTGNKYPIVIGKFSDPHKMSAVLAEKHLVVVEQVDQGIFILKKDQ